jgi:glycosyltransferase involved in cell wall biosynthesis
MDLSIVIPIKDEADNLADLFAEIVSAIEPTHYSYEVIIIDDGSRDDSWEVLTSLISKYSFIRAYRFQFNCGKAAALSLGFSKAKGHYVATLDGDLQDDPLEIPKMIRILESGYDLVSGWKKRRHDPWHKTWPSKLFNLTVSFVCGQRLQSLQLKTHRQYITKIFQVEPSGYFNSSMVWEIGMTELLAHFDFKYTLVNDDSLQFALGRTTPVSGWFTTEDKGTMIRLISVSTGLSKAFTEEEPSIFEEEIQKLPKNDKCVVVSLEVPLDNALTITSFFTSLEQKLSLLDHQTWTVAHVIEQQMTEGKVNLVSALGSNLGLPAGAHSCRELLIRRPEINFLHKSFLAVHRYALEKLSGNDLEKIEEMLLPLMAPFFYRDLYGGKGMKNPGVRWKAHKDLM